MLQRFFTYAATGAAALLVLTFLYFESVLLVVAAAAVVTYAVMHPTESINFLEGIAPYVVGLVVFLIVLTIILAIIGICLRWYVGTHPDKVSESRVMPDVEEFK